MSSEKKESKGNENSKTLAKDTAEAEYKTAKPEQKENQLGSNQSSEPDLDLSQVNDWPLQADRMAIHSPLVDCLRLMAGHYGRRISNGALTTGLPIPPTGITPALFVRAATRADLTTHLVERGIDSLAIAPNLPCILVLENGQACILWSIQYPEKSPPKKRSGENVQIDPKTVFEVQFPETETEKQFLTLKKMEQLYTGYAFFSRPVARNDDRAGPAEIDTARDWFWARLKENKTIYGEVAIASIMINLFGISSSLFIMNVYDRVVPNNAMDTLWVLAIGICIVYVTDFLLRNLRSTFLDHAGRKADIKISAALFEQVLGMTMKDRPPSAGVLASNMKEFEGLRDFFTSATMTALIDLPFVFLFIAIIGVLAGPVAFVPLAAVPLIVGMGLYLQKPLAKVIKKSLHESALKNALLFETLIGLETIKAQAAEGHTQRNWEELTEKASLTSIQSKKLSSFAQNWALFIQQLVSVFIVIVGVYLISTGDLSMGALIACVILSGRAMGPLAQVAGLMTRLNQSCEALAQLDNLMKKDVERPTGKHLVSMSHTDGLVEFRDVSFRYPGQTTPALQGVNFTIQKGERVGVIGAVGSGKTTLERLLINLYAPEQGSVQIDGVDVRQIDPGDLRRNVGAVQQSPHLFYGSVRDNITMGHETAPDRAVMKAAEISGVTEFLKGSATGLDTQVGERGEALSGGQRQAIAIARALLYDPPVLIMDEPTASMDPASEKRLRTRLETLCNNRTTILITHKGSMLSLVNKLILLDRGRLVAFGSKDEVIQKLQDNQYGSKT